jgi:outer membrane receptor protein involved in Fe transport
MKRCIRAFAATLLIPIMVAYAANGKISGTVKDAAGKPVPGANVLVEGTKLGGSADADGNYFVLNVPPGTYSVAVSAVGYEKKVYAGVAVTSDRTTELDMEINESAVELEAVVVQAQRRLVEKTQTSTRTVVTGDAITALPVLDVRALAQNTASNYEGFVRGGQRYETKTVVDGVDITDLYYSPAAIGISPGSGYVNVTRQNEAQNTIADISTGGVNEVAVNTGAVDVDYQSASAGLININLREGRGPISGKIDFRDRMPKSVFAAQKQNGPDIYWDAASYFAERNNLLTHAGASHSDTLKANRYTWYPGEYNYGDRPERNLEASLGGSLTDDLNFFANGRYFNSYGTLPNEFTRKLNLQLKSGYQLTNQIKLTAFGILEDRGELFGWKNRVYNEIMRFYLQGVPQWDGETWLGSLKWSHFLSSETYYEIQVSHTYREDRRGYVLDANGVINSGQDGNFITFADSATIDKYGSDGFGRVGSPDPNRTKFFSLGYTDAETQTAFSSAAGGGNWKLSRPVPFYEDTKTIDNSIRFDFSSQITVNHQIRLGANLGLHNLNLLRNSGMEEGYWSDTKDPIRREVWDYNPYELSFYGQDRIEYSGLIVNLGMRVDAYNRDVNGFLNWFNALYRDTTTLNPGGQALVARTKATLGSKIPTSWYLSPRIGVSHPISDDAAMYFSFAQMTQLPPLSQLYANHDGIDGITATFTTFPNVDEDPIKSTNYEVGLQWSFAPRWGVDVNAYYRDVSNYGYIGGSINQRVSPAVSPGTVATFSWQTTWGYADARGIEVTFKKLSSRLFDFVDLSGRASYTFAFIRGSAYAGGNRLDFTAALDSLKNNGNLPYNDIRVVNSYEADLAGGSTTLTQGFDRAHRVTLTAILDFPIDFRISVNGLVASGFRYPTTYLGDPRSRELATGPARKRFDVRFEKSFFSGSHRVGIYLDVLNIFNNVNILAYDNSLTGQLVWENSVKNGTPDPTGVSRRIVSSDGSVFYDIPRQVYFGITLEY